MSKLNLKKKVVSVLTDEQQASVKGGGTTSYTKCTGFLCCSPKSCDVLGITIKGNTCVAQTTCKSFVKCTEEIQEEEIDGLRDADTKIYHV